jgi:iron(III) transport system ATP-binding protein
VTEPALRLDGVTKRYAGVAAAHDVSLDAAPGELVTLIGPSGCGKSTTLRLVAGLDRPDEGRISIAGVVAANGRIWQPPERRRVGLVFQEHALFPHLTVADNISFGLRDASRAERARRGDHWLNVIGLAQHGRRYPHELSGGERQRVALARALAPEPRLVLLDEPFASLDPTLRIRLRADIVAILRSTGTPALFVTHDQAEALSIGDRVAVMREGRIEQDGPPEDVYHSPVNRFVAGFIDETAFLPVAGGQTELGHLEDSTGDGLVVLRPHDVAVAVAVDSAGTDAKVTAAEFHGASRTYTLELPSGATILVSTPHTRRLALGDVVRATLRLGAHTIVPVSDD